MKSDKKTGQPIANWATYPNSLCTAKEVTELYDKKPAVLTHKMKRSNDDVPWPPHLKTLRTLHFLMQTSSGEDIRKQFLVWKKQDAQGKFNAHTAKTMGNVNSPNSGMSGVVKKSNPIFDERGYEAEIKKVEIMTATASNSLNDLLNGAYDEKELSAHVSAQSQLMSQLIQLKKNSHSILEADLEYVHIDEVRSVMGGAIAQLKADLEGDLVVASQVFQSMDSIEKIQEEIRKVISLAFEASANRMQNLK